MAVYLNSTTATPLADSHFRLPENSVSGQHLSQHSQEAASERFTSSPMSRLTDITQNETAGDESRVDEELRQAVGHGLLECLITGFMNRGDSTTSTDSDQTGQL